MEYILHTPCGALRGARGEKGIRVFKGIRYATAGRWEYPVEVKSWEGVYDATGYGHCSYQPRAFYNEEENLKKIFYYNEFRKGETYTYSEDCLFLNIWAPEGEKQPSYVWYFDRMLPGDDNGAWHSSDLWYWFGTLKNCWRPMEAKDYGLSQRMVEYLTNFAKTGNPNGKGLPKWDAAGENAMCPGQKPARMAKPPKMKMWYTMLTNKAVGE